MEKELRRGYTPPKLTIWDVHQRLGEAPGKAYAVPKLRDLIDVEILQNIQDWAARTAGVPILIRDEEGIPVTFPSLSSDFCNLIAGEEHTSEGCRRSNVEAAAIAARTGRPQKYTCHAGLTQFAAPISVEGQLVGTIVVGDRPTRPLDPKYVESLADKFGIDRDELMKAAKSVKIWSDETMNSTINFLYSMANTLFSLCYQGYSLNRRINELTALLQISELLTSALSLQEVLDRIAQGMVETLGVRACTIRLLDDFGTELVLHSSFNLSPEYLGKGPVILEEHPVCQAAISGETVVIENVSTDPRFGYHEMARKEGLHSMLCVGLTSKDKAIGTVHLYTSVPHSFTKDEIGLVQSIANHAAAAIERAKLQRFEQELVLAGEIQAALLPDKSPELDGIDIKAKLVPSGELSGDLYDFIDLGNQCLGIVIADVIGKGAPGSILMATTRATIRTQASDTMATSEVVRRTNNSLFKDTRSTEFVSMFYAVLDAEIATLTYTNAGHNPPILFRGQEITFLEEGGLLAGVVEDASYDEGKIQLTPGDVILFYTDGVTEAINYKRRVFGLRRLIKLVRQNLALDAQSLIDMIYDEVVKFSAGDRQYDDLTIIVLKVM